jgi:hypothetical protein
MNAKSARGVTGTACFWLAGLLLLSLGLWTATAWGAEAEEGFTPIFDGKTLDGWDGDPRFWSVEDGAITGQTTPDNPTEHNTFLIWRKGKVEDFILRFEYRLIGHNSGLQYRSFENPKEWGKWVVGGYQADFEAGDRYSGILYGEKYRGILADRGQKTVIGEDHKPKVIEQFAEADELQKYVKKEDWNEYEVTATGFHFVHKINGQVMCEATDEDVEMRRTSGILAFQVHQGQPMKIQVRNVLLKRLEPKAKKKVVLIAGKPSHGYAAHEHNAGCLLLAKCLNENVPRVHAVAYNGWPKDPKALADADAIVVFADGGGGHPILPHLDEVGKLAKRGAGIGMLHYAVEVPKGEAGDRFLDWIGGYFEPFWSVNPHWTAKFESFPDHPITRGVKPFEIEDEWYYHMRFRENMEGVTPILTAVPPDSTRERPDGAHSNNPTVRARRGMPEHVAWAAERPDGGRGFGFTGGHWHWSWANDSFRTVVLNAIVWVAGLEVPPGGVPSKTPTLEELEKNQDFSPPKNFDRKRVEQLLESWK